MRIIKLVVLTVLVSVSVFSQSLTEFKTLLKSCGMRVTIPTCITESDIIENNAMGYEYAVKYPDKDFELRYAIRPITYKVYPNDSVKNEMETQRELRNSSYTSTLKSVIHNITGGYDYVIREFDKSLVKKEFNADWGATTVVELNSDFGKNYKYCRIVCIHKTDLADAYYFYLSKTNDDFSENMDPLFYTLKFN